MNEAELHNLIINRIRTVFDPEIPVNLYDLGLIYRCELKPLAGYDKYDLEIDMTLTTPNCPVAGTMPESVRRAVIDLDALNDVNINLVWDPTWDKSRMSDEARLQLDMF